MDYTGLPAVGAQRVHAGGEAGGGSPLNVARDLVTNPVSTISSVPKGIWGFLNQAGQAVKEVAEGRQTGAEEGNAGPM